MLFVGCAPAGLTLATQLAAFRREPAELPNENALKEGCCLERIGLAGIIGEVDQVLGDGHRLRAFCLERCQESDENAVEGPRP